MITATRMPSILNAKAPVWLDFAQDSRVTGLEVAISLTLRGKLVQPADDRPDLKRPSLVTP